MKKYFLPFLLFTFFSVTAFSQDSTYIYKSFNQYYKRSIEKLRDLYMVRGADFDCEIDRPDMNFVNEVSRFISRYRTVADKIGALFYSHDNDTLRIWLIADKKLYYSANRITKETLIENEYQLRNALNVTARSKQRSVVRLAEFTDNEMPVVSTVSLKNAIKTVTDILLPVKLRQHLSSLSHLYIIPEFNIGQFPFHLLQPFGKDIYLADKLSFSFIPHLCNLGMFTKQYQYEVGKEAQLETFQPLVIGNPAFSSNTGFRLPSLPGAEEEAKAVAAVMGTNAILGENATLDTVKRLAGQSDFLYFATHGYFDFEKIMDGSFLAFAPGKQKATGLWTSREIQQTKLKAKMAILSACQTGYGKVVPGGFIGLARAFYKAGVDFTVMSLWSVDDEKTKEFMLIYIEELQKPSLFYPAQPLQKAIIRFKEKNPDPIYWSAFSLFGFTY